MRKQFIAVMSVAVVLLSACASTHSADETICPNYAINPTNATANEVKTEFTVEELLEDYDQLWADLDANFPFFPVLERRGFNLERFRQDNREILAQRITDLHGFVNLLNNMVRRLDYFAHLSIVDADEYSVYSSVYNDPQDLTEAPWREILSGEQTRTTYEFLKTEANDSSANFPDVDFRYIEEVKAVYFRFKSFHFSLIERDREVVANYLSQLMDTGCDVEHIIIDITDNHGGATTYWMDNIVLPFGGKYVSDTYVFLKNTPITERFFINILPDEFLPISELPNSYEMPSFVQELGLTHYYILQTAFHFESSSSKAIESNATRWVLIDEGVYSAAESFAVFCKNSDWATLVGKTARGDGNLQSLPIVLKNTGLLFRFSTATSANSDGSMNVEVGTAPNIVCRPSESPLDTCLRAIADLGQSES